MFRSSIKDMNVLILGGISPHNQPWVHEVERALSPLADTVVVHEYAHWSQPEGTEMDIDYELRAAAEKAKSLREYAIFAKSVGTVLTLRGVASGLLAPKTCLFTGLPLKLIEREFPEMPAWISANKAPVLLMQNSQDTAGSFADVQTYLKAINADWELVELPGDSHSYEDLGTIRKLATPHLAA